MLLTVTVDHGHEQNNVKVNGSGGAINLTEHSSLLIDCGRARSQKNIY